jgi:hypothetical protein
MTTTSKLGLAWDCKVTLVKIKRYLMAHGGDPFRQFTYREIREAGSGFPFPSQHLTWLKSSKALKRGPRMKNDTTRYWTMTTLGSDAADVFDAEWGKDLC